MKKKIQLLAVAILTIVSVTVAQTKPAVWAEMKTFHSFMSTTFHSAEDGNLAPLKQKADSMFIAAKQWQVSLIPSDYKIEETKTALNKLVKQCAAIKAAVANKSSDEELKKQIAVAHDIFHTIVKECKKEDEKH